MELDLTGRVALITGASRGIGAAIAQRYAASGAKLVLSSRKREGLEAVANEIGAGEDQVAIVPAHAGDPAAAEAAIAAALERFGRLDVLVNNAATNPYMGPVIDADLPRWDKTFEVNLRGPFVWIQQAWQQWMRDNGGAIVNMASIGGMSYGGPIGVYDLTKAGLIFLTKHLANELGPKVRINAIAPGLVKTDFARALWQGAGEDATYPWPMQRLGMPNDIASAALFLASDAASWITGTVLVVDGGAVISRH